MLWWHTQIIKTLFGGDERVQVVEYLYAVASNKRPVALLGVVNAVILNSMSANLQHAEEEIILICDKSIFGLIRKKIPLFDDVQGMVLLQVEFPI